MPALVLSDPLISSEDTKKSKPKKAQYGSPEEEEKKIKKKKKHHVEIELSDLELDNGMGETMASEKKKVKKEKKRKSPDDEDKSDTTSDSTEVVETKTATANGAPAKKPKLTKDEGETDSGVADDPNALSNFRISKVLRETLNSKGIKALFPIQAMTFDLILDGFDLVGRARTGQNRLWKISNCFGTTSDSGACKSGKVEDVSKVQTLLFSATLPDWVKKQDKKTADLVGNEKLKASASVILSGFRSGRFLVLVATNVAARGLDINDVQLIIQGELEGLGVDMFGRGVGFLKFKADVFDKETQAKVVTVFSGGHVEEEIISALQGKEMGLRDHGELIKVHVVPYHMLWRVTADAKALAAIALYEMAKRNGLLP
ncbi:hypothetical protein GW17_00020793 [Ensete ventricosum]|nr:hypothetical protein GW17_00020793 [Ensete ventricosum]